MSTCRDFPFLEHAKMDKRRYALHIIVQLLTPILMSLLMNIINAVINQGFSLKILLAVIAKKWPLMMILAIFISQFVVIPAANMVVKAIFAAGAENRWSNLINALIVVICMSALMTFAKQITMNVPFRQIPQAWIRRWPRNFVIAFVLQTLVVGPLVSSLKKRLDV